MKRKRKRYGRLDNGTYTNRVLTSGWFWNGTKLGSGDDVYAFAGPDSTVTIRYEIGEASMEKAREQHARLRAYHAERGGRKVLFDVMPLDRFGRRAA